ncbi:MAG: O-antigen ligase family protein [Lutibacter sp.]|nr:O-antigen ligase family protein [Lutibacter sp.]MDT8417731.1 O-antigen ligase family protein [Lutibacter sp.]
MNNSSSHIRLILAGAHLVLGVLLLSGLVAKAYSFLILFFGVLYIIRNKNENDEAIHWSAYLVGGEVLFRMAGGMIFYELPKYAIMIFLFVGLVVEKRRHHVSLSYIIYILLLLIGIAFVDIPFSESIRKAIAFNLSGPILLGVSAIYFYRRSLTLSTMLDMLFYMALPIISMLALLYFRTPSLSDISFGGGANFETSGGYGPNQVATILGLGVFIVAVHLFFKKRIFVLFSVDVFLFTYLIYRGLITLSRGGMITAFLATAVFTYYFILSKENKILNLAKYSGLLALFGFALFLYTSNATGGMLENRYANKNAAGTTKEDFTTGRATLFASEVSAFMENPFFGVGVGGGKFYRMEELEIRAASHNEMGRLIGEHGLVGIVALLLLIIVPIRHMFKQPYLARAFLASFLIFWFLTINHSAMRIAFPGFIYGLSVAVIVFNNKEAE